MDGVQVPLGRLSGVRNLRDLGGTPTRDGRALRAGCLLRSASLHGATDGDLDVLRDAGVRDVVDLRADWEVAEAGPVPAGFTCHRLVVVPDAARRAAHAALRDEGLPGYYRWILDHATAELVQLVDLVATAPAAVLVQCGAGKDRTGVAVAVLLDLLDVEDAVIAADYARTAQALRAIRADMLRTPGYERTLADLPPGVMGAPPEAITAALEGLRADAGSVAGHLRRHGLDDDRLDALRARLVAPLPAATA